MPKRTIIILLSFLCCKNIIETKDIEISDIEKDLFVIPNKEYIPTKLFNKNDITDKVKSIDNDIVELYLNKDYQDNNQNNQDDQEINIYNNIYSILCTNKLILSNNKNYNHFFENINNIEKKRYIYKTWKEYININISESIAIFYIYENLICSLNIKKAKKKSENTFEFYSTLKSENILYKIDNQEGKKIIYTIILLSKKLKDKRDKINNELHYNLNYDLIKSEIKDLKGVINNQDIQKFIDNYLDRSINIQFKVIDGYKIEDKSLNYPIYFSWQDQKFIISDNTDDNYIKTIRYENNINNLKDHIDTLINYYDLNNSLILHIDTSIEEGINKIDIFNINNSLLDKLTRLLKLDKGVLGISVNNNSQFYSIVINKTKDKDIQFIIIKNNKEDSINYNKEINPLRNILKIKHITTNIDNNNLDNDSTLYTNSKDENNSYDEDTMAKIPQITRAHFAGSLPEKIEDLIFILKSDDAKNLITKMPAMAIMYGPAGTGKTTLAEILASETGRLFKSIKASELFDKYYGESQKKLRNMFQVLKKQSIDNNKKIILFIDEIDAIAADDDDPKNFLRSDLRYILNDELDKINNENDNIFCICATNKLGLLDSTLTTRAQGYIIKIDNPTLEQRIDILRFYLEKRSNINNRTIEQLGKMTANYSARELRAIVDKAAINTLKNRKDFRKDCKYKISTKDILASLKSIEQERLNQKYESNKELYKKADKDIQYREIILERSPMFSKYELLNNFKSRLTDIAIGGVISYIGGKILFELLPKGLNYINQNIKQLNQNENNQNNNNENNLAESTNTIVESTSAIN